MGPVLMYGIVDGSQELILSTVKPLRKDSINVVTGINIVTGIFLKRKVIKLPDLL